MAVTIDDDRIRDRRAQRRQQRLDGVDLWVELTGLDRPAGVVSAAVARLPGGSEAWDVRPTAGGAWVWLWDARDWRHTVPELADALTGDGHSGSISVPWVDPWLHRTSEVPFPTAYLSHRVDPPADAGPINEHGVPEPRWGVPEPLTRQLISQAARWVLVPGTGAHVGGAIRTPVQEIDAVDVIRPMLDTRYPVLVLASTPLDEPVLRRAVEFYHFGQTWWNDLDGDAESLDLVDGRREQLVQRAPELDYGSVHLTHPDTNTQAATTTGHWRRRPHLRSAYVPDAFGMQLLTGRQLSQAHDLSRWDVSEVAEDRWLVTTRDLAAWFTPADPTEVRRRRFPDPALRAQAREDFGAMILTRDTPGSGPLPPSPV